MRFSPRSRTRRFLCLALTALTMSSGVIAADKYKIDKKGGGSLYTTTARIDVFAEPKPESKKLATYDPGAIMAVIGEATGTGFLYVSPCNACDKGFVPKAEFLSKAKR